MTSALLASFHWGLAKHFRGRDEARHLRHLLKSARMRPQNDPKMRRSVDALVKAKRFDDALALCKVFETRDVSQYWSTYRSFVEEASASPVTAGSPRIALFNDTDFRVNIGCRLTSQGLKHAILRAFPGAGITSLGFRFSTFHEDFGSSIASDPTDAALHARLLHAYGGRALEAIATADMVVLQPEGSLDEKTSLEGLATFFAPVLVARRLGKPCAIVNGTIPGYGDERDAYLARLFTSLRFVAARDEISAAQHGVTFLPDAAFLRIEPEDVADRDGCLITTGARNKVDDDVAIFRSALAACEALGLRPVVLTRAAGRFAEFEAQVLAQGGIFAEAASIEAAAAILSRCRLHIGGRYHMAIFSTMCRVPTLLYDVKTHKNQWLAQYSPLVRLVRPGADIPALAAEALSGPVSWTRPTIDYEGFLRAAYAAAHADSRAG